MPGPVVGADGSILSASNAGTLHALDPATGADRWTFDGHGGYGDDLSTSPLVLADGTILWPGPRDTLFALNRTGGPLWEEPLGGLVLSPALGPNGRVYVTTRSGTLTALEVDAAGQHRRVWTIHLGGSSYGSPAIASDGTVVTSGGSDLVAVRDHGDRGQQIWRFATGAMIEVSPAVGPHDTLVVGSNDGNEYGIGLDGKRRWRFHIGDFPYSSSTVAAGKVRFGDNNGHLFTLDAATGTKLSDARTKPSRGSPDGIWTAAATDRDGNAYFGTVGGHILGAAPDGTILFDIRSGGMVASYPALDADGTLYIGSADGYVYAIVGGGV